MLDSTGVHTELQAPRPGAPWERLRTWSSSRTRDVSWLPTVQIPPFSVCHRAIDAESSRYCTILRFCVCGHLVECGGACGLGQQIDLVQHHDQRVHQDVPNHQALSIDMPFSLESHCIESNRVGCCYLSGLSLDALDDIDHEDHHVDDLCTSDDGSNERCMTWTIHERELHQVVRASQPLRRCCDGHEHGDAWMRYCSCASHLTLAAKTHAS